MDKFSEMVSFGMDKCPFLKNIAQPTNFNFKPSQVQAPDGYRSLNDDLRPCGGTKAGPIFEDGPSFDVAFRLFHGSNGVVPLSKLDAGEGACPYMSSSPSFSPSPSFAPSPLAPHPESLAATLAASAATISLSSFGPLGPFSYDSFRAAQEKRKKSEEAEKKRKLEDNLKQETAKHEALGPEWLASGNCPIAKSYRALSGMLPLVAKAMTLPPGMKYKCPPAIVAARAALAKTSAVKALRPQLLPVKVLAIGMLGMSLNIPLGVWREHCEKFSPQWILAVHAAVPFIAMLRKAVIMPKYAMVFTIASCVIGQGIGARVERRRLKGKEARADGSQVLGLPPLKPKKKKRGGVRGDGGHALYTAGCSNSSCADFNENKISGLDPITAAA